MGGGGGCCVARTVVYEDCERARAKVKKPLLSVCGMCKAGRMAVFDIDADRNDRSHSIHGATGENANFQLRNRALELDLEVAPRDQAEKIATEVWGGQKRHSMR